MRTFFRFPLSLTTFSMLWVALLPSAARTDEPSAAEPARHCVAEVVPDHLRTTDGPDAEPEPTCFGSFSEALYFATGGHVWLGRDAGPEALRDEDLERASRAGSTLVGINYRLSRYRGGTFSWFAPNTVGCRTGYRYGRTQMPSGWNDDVSSSKAFGGCDAFYHYEHRSYVGAVLRCRENVIGCDNARCSCYSMGAMHDKTSSLRWYRSGFHY